MNSEHIRDDIAAGRAVIEEIFDAADRDEYSEDDLARVDMLWRAVDNLLQDVEPPPGAIHATRVTLHVDPDDARAIACVRRPDVAYDECEPAGAQELREHLEGFIEQAREEADAEAPDLRDALDAATGQGRR